jgi:hypothetical protein
VEELKLMPVFANIIPSAEPEMDAPDFSLPVCFGPPDGREHGSVRISSFSRAGKTAPKYYYHGAHKHMQREALQIKR